MSQFTCVFALQQRSYRITEVCVAGLAQHAWEKYKSESAIWRLSVEVRMCKITNVKIAKI